METKLQVLLRPPEPVRKSKESKKGLHWALEILVFLVVFAACTFGEVMVMLPVQMVMLIGNSDYQKAVASGDMALMEETVSSAVNTDTYAILTLFATGVMILFVLLFCRLAQKRKPSALGFTAKGSGKEYLKGVLIGAGMFSAAVLICILTGSLKLSFEKDSFVLSSFFLFTVGYMIQGMAEETLCRGYFMVSFGRRYPMGAAVLINAAVFAALHLFNPGIGPLPILNLVLFGIFASICFIRTENIWLIGALHSAWNLVQGNIFGIKVSGTDTSCRLFLAVTKENRALIHGGDFGLEGGLAVTVVLAAGIAFFLFFGNDKKNNDLAVEGS